jgi:isopenicillin-N epimerase
MDKNPMEFFLHEFYDIFAEARAAVSSFVGAQQAGLVFGVNTTALVGAVLGSLSLKPGDEIVVLNHAYGAVRNAAQHACDHSGATLVVADLPLPVEDPQDLTDAVLDAVTDRTVLAVVDHITSPTALVLPVEDIVRELNRRGVDSLVDGAHAPGMTTLALDQLRATYYVGNLHKWVSAPKSVAFMSVREGSRTSLRPSVISHGATGSTVGMSRLHLEFDWVGTADLSAVASTNFTLQEMAAMVPGGWDEIYSRNHDLVVAGATVIRGRLGTPPMAPDSMFGSMAIVELPGGMPDPPQWPSLSALQTILDEKYKIPVPIIAWPTRATRLIRLSAHLYNSIEQYEYLADALAAEL